MRDSHSRVDGARVLADLNALGGIGDYKTDVHKPASSRNFDLNAEARMARTK
jgi:N-carbamoyl-L-amino-acid hydrolase